MKSLDVSLYAIIDPEHSAGRSMPELVRAAADNGATLIQYRDKVNGVREMIAHARAIRATLAGTGVALIINDRVDVALACNADGVHLGQTDMVVADARALLGKDAIIGLSIKTIEEAENCPVDLIDYAFVGGVFPTTSKDNPTAIGLDGWMLRANLIKNRQADMPVGAIAGINRENAGELVKAGCDGIAVISAIFMADDVAQATRNLRQAMDEA